MHAEATGQGRCKKQTFIRIMRRCLKPVARRVGVALTQSWGVADAVGNERLVCLWQR